MTEWIVKQIVAALKKQLTPQSIEKMVSLLPPAKQAAAGEEITLCALQMELKPYSSLSEWLRSLDATLSQAVSRGSRLVCLPEFYAMMPLVCHTAVGAAVKMLPRISGGTGGGGKSLSIAPLAEKVRFLAPAYEEIICRLARRYGIYLYGGTGFVWEGGKVFNRGFLATPQGSVAARQDKIHLTEEEIALGITPGDMLQVVPTPIGNIALCVCMDATYFETFRVAKGLGADYIIVPIGDMAEFDPWLALRGAQMRVNETGLAAVKPALVTAPGFPIPFSGKAGIYFPADCDLEPREHPDPRMPGMVTAQISLKKLRETKSQLFGRKNPKFDRNYCGQLIQAACSRENQL